MNQKVQRPLKQLPRASKQLTLQFVTIKAGKPRASSLYSSTVCFECSKQGAIHDQMSLGLDDP